MKKINKFSFFAIFVAVVMAFGGGLLLSNSVMPNVTLSHSQTVSEISQLKVEASPAEEEVSAAAPEEEVGWHIEANVGLGVYFRITFTFDSGITYVNCNPIQPDNMYATNRTGYIEIYPDFEEGYEFDSVQISPSRGDIGDGSFSVSENWVSGEGCKLYLQVWSLQNSYIDVDIDLSSILKTYTMKFNSNGGSGYMSSDEKKHGRAFMLPGCDYTKTGYTFDGWKAGSTIYDAYDYYYGNSDTTFYAQWTPDTYTVSYNANGATSGSAPSSQTKTYGVNLTLRTNSGSLSKTGYTFNGWNTKSDGTGTNYAAGGSYTSDSGTTLYAKWT
ncbi:MAG: InlB B-repeat-containing protein, partial [Clostridia bacterium]|nr:InlB B-repeat-containing protein [Clostridia bacterium]